MPQRFREGNKSKILNFKSDAPTDARSSVRNAALPARVRYR
ncbi:hypothetical protein [Nostoc punctiforme]|nr:hypothetical protein [Nostoc punctiforme]